MTPGPDQIVACPHCQGLAKYLTLMSGNTFDARVWTDGKRIAPMLPQPPPVVKCRHCARCYWLADAKKIGTVGAEWAGALLAVDDQPHAVAHLHCHPDRRRHAHGVEIPESRRLGGRIPHCHHADHT